MTCPWLKHIMFTFLRESRSFLLFGLYARHHCRVPRISLVFREMWDTTGLPSSLPGRHNSVGVPHVRTSVARISYYAALDTTAYAAFSQRKPHEVTQRHHFRKGIRDTWAENAGRSPPQFSSSWMAPSACATSGFAGRISARFAEPGANPAACSSSISAPLAGQPPDCVPESARRCRGEAQSPWSRCWSA